MARDESGELRDASPLGRFLGRRAELDHFSPFVHRNPFGTPPEIDRYVKLNYSRHGSVLPIVFRSAKKQLPRWFPHGWPSHSHPHWQRVESLSLSFLRSALHKAHDLIHILRLHFWYTMFDSGIVVPDAAQMSFDCQTNPLYLSHIQRSKRVLFASRRPRPRALHPVHTSLCQLKQNRFADSYQAVLFSWCLTVIREGRCRLAQPSASHRSPPPTLADRLKC